MQEIIELASANPLLSIIWVALVATIIYTTVKEKTAKYKIIDTTELTRLVNHEDAKVVDVRPREEFRLGHITNAVQVNAADIEKDNLANVSKNKEQAVIVVCKNGQQSVKSAAELTKHDYSNVYVLKDGLISWAEAKLPLVRGKN